MKKLAQKSPVMAEIKLLSQGLSEGDSLAGQVCPQCGGGQNQDKSFSLSRTNTGVLYICHRASCGIKGFINMSLSPLLLEHDKPPEIKPKANKSNYMSFAPLNAMQRGQLIAKYHLSDRQINFGGLRWSTTEDRLILPIRGVNGRTVGFVARSENPEVKPKALTYLHTTETACGAFYITQPLSRRIWLVEDQLSALRLTEYTNSLALLGTNLSKSLLAELKACKIESVTVCLDADAKEKAFSISKNISGLFGHIAVRFPPKDIKNMTFFELRDFMKENNG